MAYGLQLSGFRIKRLQNILTEIKQELWASSHWGPNANLSSRSSFGQFMGAVSGPVADVWVLAQTAYNALNPETAEGVLLDNLCALVGVERDDATALDVALVFTGTAGVTVPSGSIVRVNGGARFRTTQDWVIGLGGTVAATATAINAGYLEVGAGTVANIVTAVLGWSSVSGPVADTEGGSDIETDLELRRKRRVALQAGGSATDGAIRAAVVEVDGVEQATVVSNRSLVTAGGIPGKAFHTIVYPLGLSTAIQKEIAEAIYRTMPAGNESYGSEAWTVTDIQGYSQSVAFSFATPVTVNVTATVKTNATYAPADAEDQMEAAVVDLFEGLADPVTSERSGGLLIGEDVLYAKVFNAIFDSIPGIISITLALSGGSPDVPISLAAGEIGVLGTNVITEVH